MGVDQIRSPGKRDAVVAGLSRLSRTLLGVDVTETGASANR